MAENIINTTARSEVIAAPGHTCAMSGCIAHGPGQSTNQKTGAVTRYIVHFRTSDKIMRHAIESFNRGIALVKRNGNSLPTDRVLDLYDDYSYSKTTDEVLEEEAQNVAKMSDEQRDTYVKTLMLKLQAAQKKTSVQSPAHSENKKK